MQPSTAQASPFHQHLLSIAEPIWDATLAHPFLISTADGSIADETFGTWLVQDYLFVQGTVPFLGVLIAKAPLDLYAPLADAIVVLNRELDLFRQQAEVHGVLIDGSVIAPTCHAYVQFLMATAYGRPFEQGFTVLYGLEKAYLDAWTTVKTRQRSPSPWQAFIDNWTSDAFQGYVAWLASTLDRLVVGKSETDLASLEQIFLLTARYEYLFWDMAISGEIWPV